MKRPPFFVKKTKKLPAIVFLRSLIRPFLTRDETKVLSCYHIKVPKRGRVEQAYHKKAVELIWVIRGGGYATLNNSRIRLNRGSILFIRPLTLHGFRATRSGMEMLAICSPRVDSQTDFYLPDGRKPESVKVISGHWPMPIRTKGKART